MPETSRRFDLRDRTAQAHAALDTTVGGFETLAHYRTYLAGQAAFRLPIERHLQALAIPAAFGAWRPRLVAPQLSQDLADLAVDADGPDMAVGATLEGLLGLFYVLEGSSLGAQLLYRRAQALGLGETYGARHLACQSGTLGNWREFLALLEAIDAADMDKVAAAAVSAFAAATTAFAR